MPVLMQAKRPLPKMPDEGVFEEVVKLNIIHSVLRSMRSSLLSAFRAGLPKSLYLNISIQVKMSLLHAEMLSD